MKLIILGPPGTGKGTQARELAKKFNLEHFSTGKKFREAYEKGTELGKKAQSYWGEGNLVPDEVTIKLVQEHLPQDNYILDGYPRNLAQAEALEKYQKTDIVLYINSTMEICIKRLLKRAELEGRSDDTEEIIKHRIEVYRKETEPILNFYKAHKDTQFHDIDGNRDPEPILKEILELLKQ